MKHLNVSFLLTNVPKPVVGWVILSCKSHILLSVSAFEKKNVVPTSLMGDVKTISNNSFPWDKFEINANLFCPSRNKKHGVIWSLFLALHDVIRCKKAVWSWSYWTIVLHWERLCSFFLKAYWGDWFSKTNSFLCGSMAWIQTILKLQEKKQIIVHVLMRFCLNMLKIKMRNSRNRRKFEFFTGYFLRR